jgi:tRNA-dihydrouridine synthase
MSKVPAHWERMSEIRELVRSMTGEVKDGGTLLLGNGDVTDLEDGEKKVKDTGIDGVMIGRGIFGTPWLFDRTRSEEHESVMGVKERLNILVEHTKLYEELLGDIKSFAIMKKHFKAYVNGFDGAKELRSELMECVNGNEVGKIIERYLTKVQ